MGHVVSSFGGPGISEKSPESRGKKKKARV